jgi:hypothetical protein
VSHPEVMTKFRSGYVSRMTPRPWGLVAGGAPARHSIANGCQVLG